MSMKVTRVHTWWTVDQADAVIGFMDELRDQLWHTYGDQITAMRLAEQEQVERDAQQGQLDLKGGYIDF
ncbi:MAG: hypothetical protein V3U76_18470 [Granulosicoccus sp.]